MQFTRKTLTRAKRAVACSPFKFKAFAQMNNDSLSLVNISGDRGYISHYTTTTVSELVAERSLLWLIQVGVLRREVDGQGLTDSFRLTPLGRQIIETWQPKQTIPQASWGDRILNFWIRMVHFVF